MNAPRKSSKLWSSKIKCQTYLIWVIFGSSPILNVPDTCELYDPKLDVSTWAAWDILRTFLLRRVSHLYMIMMRSTLFVPKLGINQIAGHT